MRDFFRDDEPRKPEEIFAILQSLRDATFEKFNFIAGIREKSDFYANYQGRLKEIIDSKESKSFEINEQMNNE